MRKACIAWLQPPNSVDVGTISLQYMITAKAKGGVQASVAANVTYCWWENFLHD